MRLSFGSVFLCGLTASVAFSDWYLPGGQARNAQGVGRVLGDVRWPVLLLRVGFPFVFNKRRKHHSFSISERCDIRCQQVL